MILISAEFVSVRMPTKARFPESRNLLGNMTDPIADMIVRFTNAGKVRKDSVSVPFSKLKSEICSTLEKEGYVKSVARKGKTIGQSLEVGLLYVDGQPRITGVRRVSKPSRRIYRKANEIRPVKNGYGMAILSTPKGILSGSSARKEKVGGEVLFEIW